MDILRKKLAGSTVIETLIAMTLIITTISFSFLCIISIRKSYNMELKTNAFLNANKQLEEVDQFSYEINVIKYPSYSISIKKTLFTNNHNLLLINVVVLDSDSLILYKVNKILKINSQDE